MKTLKLVASIIAVALTSVLTGQSTGSIKGTISDNRGIGVPYAGVGLLDGTAIINSVSADEKGDFSFTHLTPGIYNLQFSSMGFETKKVMGVEVEADRVAYVYKTLNVLSDTLVAVEVTDTWEKPIIDPVYSTITKIDIDQIAKSATGRSDVIALVTIMTPAVITTPDGKDIYIRGSRQGTSGYYVDGNKMIGPPQIPGLSISGMEVLTGGMPAEYGDCTGGLVIISTKDYKWEMRRKQMAKTAREENEVKEQDPKKKKWYFTIH